MPQAADQANPTPTVIAPQAHTRPPAIIRRKKKRSFATRRLDIAPRSGD